MYDLSNKAVEKAKENAKGLSGFYAKQADVNKLSLTEKYDLIAFSQSLHHIENLEHVLSEVKHGLAAKDGVFFVSDYIGPSRMQWTEVQLKWMNLFLSHFPGKLRKTIDRRINGSDSKNQVKRIPVEKFISVDPSEAVRSEEIEEIIRRTFRRVEFYSMGGGISYELFRGIAHNFDPENEEHNSIIKLTIGIEKQLEEMGIIRPSFGLFICQV